MKSESRQRYASVALLKSSTSSGSAHLPRPCSTIQRAAERTCTMAVPIAVASRGSRKHATLIPGGNALVLQERREVGLDLGIAADAGIEDVPGRGPVAERNLEDPSVRSSSGTGHSRQSLRRQPAQDRSTGGNPIQLNEVLRATFGTADGAV